MKLISHSLPPESSSSFVHAPPSFFPPPPVNIRVSNYFTNYFIVLLSHRNRSKKLQIWVLKERRIETVTTRDISGMFCLISLWNYLLLSIFLNLCLALLSKHLSFFPFLLLPPFFLISKMIDWMPLFAHVLFLNLFLFSLFIFKFFLLRLSLFFIRLWTQRSARILHETEK